jgi:superfamily II DNA or RNA helicase
MTTVKPSHKLTFHDLLSRLTFEQASKLIGDGGKKLIMRASHREIDVREQVRLGRDQLQVTFRYPAGGVEAMATLRKRDDARDRLDWMCNRCDTACEHVGAMFSCVLECKTQLGLAALPSDREPVAELSDEEVVRRALEERRQRAKTERMRIKSTNSQTPWTDYVVTSLQSGKSYRVALRGFKPGDSYCACPDFRTNTLGTCKHLMKLESSVKKRFSAQQLKQPFRHRQIEVHLRYDGEVTLRLASPSRLAPQVAEVIQPLTGKPITDVSDMLRRLRRLDVLEESYHIYPDAEEFVQQRLYEARMRGVVAEIHRDPAAHPLRTTLLKTALLPYQLEGIAFVAGAGRAVLADDMGLGKTIQGVGVAEFLAREANIRKVLIVCPASLKSQWRNEINRFCDRDVQLIAGRSAERTSQYANDCFFTICNYEQVIKDILSIEQTPWDLIVLDEAQRIKNWETKTSRVIKALKSRFALCLTGTPLENRLDDLYSVVQFVDDRRLGPGFRFFQQHRVVDDKGKVLGYRNLDSLRERLRPVLLRRTRESVQLQLPARTTEIVRIPPTDEQKVLHDSHMQTVAAIVSKKYLTEMDLVRLRIALLMCRMSANGTFLVNKETPNWSTKLERLAELCDNIVDEPDRKVVLFSEWTTMLELIEPLLNQRRLKFVRLDGSVPQKKRQELVHEFQTDPKCRFFLTTNAGSTGLNLQAANTVINVDLPWNPAVLEQRIARAHRMGQKQPVHVFVLVTEQTLEENLLDTLAAKRDLSLAVLDPTSEVAVVDLMSGAEELKTRLEVLLGAKPEANIDQTEEQKYVQAAREQQHRARVAAAGGEMLGALFQFVGELVGPADIGGQVPDEKLVSSVRSRLSECVQEESDGQQRLTFTLPNRQALESLAKTLSRLLVSSGAEGGRAE